MDSITEKKVVTTGACDMLILDEVLGIVDEKVISPEEICELFAAKPEERLWSAQDAFWMKKSVRQQTRFIISHRRNRLTDYAGGGRMKEIHGIEVA